jgi:hypothetical protein
MKKPYRLVCCFSIPLFLLITGCSKPILKMPESMPAVVKAYKHVTIYRPNRAFKETGIYIQKGELYSVLPSLYYFMSSLAIRIGQEDRIFSPFYHNKATSSGPIFVRVPQFALSSRISHVAVDIFVWEKEDWHEIVRVIEQLKQKDPQNETLVYALEEALRRREIFVAEAKTSQEIEDTKKELETLKETPESETGQGLPSPTKEMPVASVNAPEGKEKLEKLAQLEEKLVELTAKLAELDEMKKQLSQEREKSSLLSEELEERKKREEDLLVKLKEGTNAPPVIVIASPKDGTEVENNIIHLTGVAEDDKGLSRLEMSINNKPIMRETGRGVRIKGEGIQKRINISERILLEKGENRIRIRAVDSDGLWSENRVTVHKLEIRRNIWAVVIGINAYPNVRQLKFAVNDARMFYDHLVKDNKIPTENVTLLVDREATLTKLRSALGTHLKNKGGKEDMVIIFFAGHGATEKDVMSPDGDGLEKYLLPYDADPRDLYATALPMGEISRIFKRIRSERLVFLADSCYSGASGGRTIDITGIRASISDAFLDRVASGKGRVIMTASGANEVSAENDELKHGVFTYYLVEGLKGMADADGDGLITVEEVYRYVSDKVPQATGQEQHPVKKGTVEGRLILGVTR